MASDAETRLVPVANPIDDPEDKYWYRPQIEFVYKETPQADLRVILHLPFNWQPGDKRPGIVFFFGGGWRGGARSATMEQFTRQATYLASRGMVTARADLRVRTRHGVMPDKCVEDAKSAVRWLRMNAAILGIDGDRVVTFGASSGGHMALCTGTVPGLDAPGEDLDVSSVPNAMVLFNPVLRTHDIKGYVEGFGQEMARRISPALYLSQNTPPMLMTFGTEDKWFALAPEFLERTVEVGCRAELYLVEGQDHGFHNVSPWTERTLYRADEFLASLGYVQGPPTFDLP